MREEEEEEEEEKEEGEEKGGTLSDEGNASASESRGVHVDVAHLVFDIRQRHRTIRFYMTREKERRRVRGQER